MAKDLNKIMLTGNLGADPELRYLESGTPLATFRVASSRRWGGADGAEPEDTEWFRIVAWERLAETCANSLSKGDRVYIEGRLRTRTWHDQHGKERIMTEVIAQDVIILSRGRDQVAVTEEGEGGVPEMAAPPTRSAPRPRTSARPHMRGHSTLAHHTPRAFTEADLPL